ncbi:MAG: hypothetical protein LAT77_05325 [Aliidiomarina sp.]|uniref:hypothetical protein n=1 Tax=Aliidiomarina sp. TaxID=1872439 RepID=UPI0025BFABDF|nr:hypothetical protein [Aliidiomarina sp.]MCH8501318.1 hypothetical protein [Aliidiomarina sp.]
MRLNGQFWLVILVLSALVTLPFAGGALASAPHILPVAAATDTHHATDMQSLADEEHCELMAKMAAQRADKPAIEAEATTDHVETTLHDCCDQDSACYLNCPVDCGHCLSVGHGCMAALTGLNIASPILIEFAIQGSVPDYSLLLVQATKPPIIA